MEQPLKDQVGVVILVITCEDGAQRVPGKEPNAGEIVLPGSLPDGEEPFAALMGRQCERQDIVLPLDERTIGKGWLQVASGDPPGGMATRYPPAIAIIKGAAIDGEV